MTIDENGNTSRRRRRVPVTEFRAIRAHHQSRRGLQFLYQLRLLLCAVATFIHSLGFKTRPMRRAPGLIPVAVRIHYIIFILIRLGAASAGGAECLDHTFARLSHHVFGSGSRPVVSKVSSLLNRSLCTHLSRISHNREVTSNVGINISLGRCGVQKATPLGA